MEGKQHLLFSTARVHNAPKSFGGFKIAFGQVKKLIRFPRKAFASRRGKSIK
jgi:hypothetical protein